MVGFVFFSCHLLERNADLVGAGSSSNLTNSCHELYGDGSKGSRSH